MCSVGGLYEIPKLTASDNFYFLIERQDRKLYSCNLSADRIYMKKCPARQHRQANIFCLTICGYREPGISEEVYRHHITQISAPMTKVLMVKYGIKRCTVIHNTTATRKLMAELYDQQMANVADFDCFSQGVLERLEDYKRMKAGSCSRCSDWLVEHIAAHLAIVRF